jgi:hypothetical protein
MLGYKDRASMDRVKRLQFFSAAMEKARDFDPEKIIQVWKECVQRNHASEPGDVYFRYLSSVSDTSKKPRSDFHIFTWDT